MERRFMNRFLNRSAVLFTILLISLVNASAALGGAGAPRFMALINERNMGAYSMGDAERVVTAYLIAKGMEVVDPELVKTSVNRDKALQAISGGPHAVAAMGLQFGADIIIVGNAIAKGSAERVRDSSFRSYRATVSLKAVRTDTAQVIGVATETAVQIHVDDIAGGSGAIQKATTRLVASLLPDVIAKMGGRSAGQTRTVQLVLGGARQVWQVAAVKKLLRENIAGVKDVTQRSFVSGVAMFDVRWAGDSQKLAEELTLAHPKYFRFKVLGVSLGKLDVRLVESEQ